MKIPMRASGGRTPYFCRWVITRTDEREIYHARGGTSTQTASPKKPVTQPKVKKATGTPPHMRWKDLREKFPRESKPLDPINNTGPDYLIRRPKPWLSPKRPAANDRETIVKFNISSVRTISYLSFKLLDTPCTWSVYYLDSTTNQLLPVTDAEGEILEGEITGNELNIDEEDGGPARSNKDDDDNSNRPWESIESLLANDIKTKLIEVHIKRKLIYIDNGNETARTSGIGYKYGLFRTVPYRIGLRDFEAKVIVHRTDTSVVYDPHNVYDETITIDFNNPNQAVDYSTDTAWISAPQAAAKSIVPFYMDLRSGTDEAFTFDTMDLLPLYTGPMFNMYYSNDDTVARFTTANAFYDVIEDLTVANDVSWERAGVSEFSTQIQPESGLSLPDSDSYVLIDNEIVRWNLKDNFSFGLEWSPTTYVSPATPPANRHLFTIVGPIGDISLKYNTATQKFIVVNTNLASIETILVQSSAISLSADSYSIVVSYSNNTWSIRAVATGATNLDTTVTNSPSWTSFWPTELILGNNKTKTLSATGYLRNIWARLSEVDDTIIDAFVSDPNKFSVRNDNSVISGNYMAVLLAPLKYSSKIALGPNPEFYEKKQWTPVSDDYKLGNTSTYDLPKITAKYVALEFTNLVPQFHRASSYELLELRDFPNEVKNYYRSLPHSYGQFPKQLMINLFEGIRTNVAYNKGVENDIPALRDTLTYGDGGPVFIYAKDQSTIDFLKDPSQYDRNTTLEELKFAAKMMKFFNKTWHNYILEFVVPEIDRAYFVGIKDVRFYRSAQDIPFDTPEYFDTFDDDSNISSSTNIEFLKTSADTGYIQSNFSSPATSATVVSKTFESISDFYSARMAVIDGPWKTTIDDDEINLVNLSSLQGVRATFAAEPLSTYQGAKMGNVISVTPTGKRYGVRSEALTYAPKANQRISGAVRILTDKEGKGKGHFVLNLKGTINSTVTTLMSKRIALSSGWQEVDLMYISQGTEINIYLEILQIDDTQKFSFLVDMIGVWYNPVIWEISNDNGANYVVPAITFGDLRGFIKFKTSGKQIKVRITITESGIAVSTWSIIPDYQLMTYLLRTDMLTSQPWTSSDNPKLRPLLNHPLYRLKSRPWPNRFSISR